MGFQQFVSTKPSISQRIHLTTISRAASSHNDRSRDEARERDLARQILPNAPDDDRRVQILPVALRKMAGAHHDKVVPNVLMKREARWCWLPTERSRCSLPDEASL
jgi:hypothetical protein